MNLSKFEEVAIDFKRKISKMNEIESKVTAVSDKVTGAINAATSKVSSEIDKATAAVNQAADAASKAIEPITASVEKAAEAATNVQASLGLIGSAFLKLWQGLVFVGVQAKNGVMGVVNLFRSAPKA